MEKNGDLQRVFPKKDLFPVEGNRSGFRLPTIRRDYSIQLVSTFMRPSGIMPIDHVEAGTSTVSP